MDTKCGIQKVELKNLKQKGELKSGIKKENKKWGIQKGEYKKLNTKS